MSDMRASRLMGTNIRNAQGQDLGELADMVVDVTKNRIHYAIVERGGVLGIGEKAIAVPITQFRTGAREGDLVLNMTEQQLKDAPGLERNVEWNDPRTWSNVGQYYHRTLGVPATAAEGRFQRASDVLGMDVLDRTGDEVGEIEDLVVNLSDGSIHYAVLEFDRAWNPNDKLVALPMSSLQPAARGNDLTINMTRERLASAPSFDNRQWPDMADSSFRNRVSTFGRDTVGMDSRGTMVPTTMTTIWIVDEPEFLRLDGDRDGRLSRGEVRAVSRLNQQWEKLDRNSDGYLSRDEIGNRPGATAAQSDGQKR
jgi:sporulation protein YlmC with PRC-barrel domain